jgi:hypothetical protein
MLRPHLEVDQAERSVGRLAGDAPFHRDGLAHDVERRHAEPSDADDATLQADVLAHRPLPHAQEHRGVRGHLRCAGSAGELGVVVDGVEVAVGTGGDDKAVHGQRELDRWQLVAFRDVLPVPLLVPVHGHDGASLVCAL